MAHINELADDLTLYVTTYFGGLMTPQEKVGYKSVIGELKILNNPAAETALRKFFCSTDPGVVGLLRDGPEAFLLRVRERVLRENADKVFLNYCPRCHALARTPRAKQCHNCFLDWHGTNNEAGTPKI